MNKTLKNNALVLILLTTSIQTLQCYVENNNAPSTWQMFITFLYGNPEQPPVKTNQVPTGITEEHYIAQFCYDLNGERHPNKIPLIPWNEVDKMAAIMRPKLRLIDLNNPNQANKVIRSVLKDYVKTETINDLLQSHDLVDHGMGYSDVESIATSTRGNIKASLKRAPHLNGESIAQYFGEHRKSAARRAFFDRKYNR